MTMAAVCVERQMRPEHGRDRLDGAGELSCWLDRLVLDDRGETLGVLIEIYADGLTRRPAWLAIDAASGVVVAPVRGASLLGEDVVIAHARRTVATAPAVEVLGTVDPAQEQLLSNHYGRRASRR